MILQIVYEIIIAITLLAIAIEVVITRKELGKLAKLLHRSLFVAFLTAFSYLMFMVFVDNHFYAKVSMCVFSVLIDWLLISFMNYTREYTDQGFGSRPIGIIVTSLAALDTVDFILNVRFEHVFTLEKTSYENYGVTAWTVNGDTLFYQAHLVLSYILAAIVLILLIRKAISVPRFYVKKYIYIMISFVAILLLDGLSMILHVPYNIGVFGYGIASIILTYLSLSFIPNQLVGNMIKLVVQDIQDTVVCYDQNGKVVFTNNAVNRMLSENMRADYLAQKYRDWRISYADSPNRRHQWEEVVEYKGVVRHFEVVAQKLYDDNEKYIGVYFITSDRTEEVARYEKQLEKSEAQSDQRSQFWTNIAHELRTPMNTILGMNELILRESEEDSIKEYAADVRTALDSMIALVNDVLDFSKLDSNKMQILTSEYEMLHLIKNAVTLIRPKANEKGLHLNLEIDQYLPSRLLGDELRIQQVIINLLTNAVKYTEEGSVTLRIFGERRYDEFFLHVEVEDTGIGIREQNIPLLFEAYERLDEAKVHGIQGTGLGLNICSQLLEQMGSKLEIESAYGKGSRFFFAINQPIVDGKFIGNYEDYEADEKKAVAKAAAAAKAEPVNQKMRLLLVDDNNMNRIVFKALLKKAGVVVTEAENGEEAIRLVQEQTFDLIFLDHLMPGMNGDEVLHVMKNDTTNKNRNVPVVMLTANAMEGAEQFFKQAGFDDFLAKPVEPALLEATIAKWAK